MIVGSRSGLAGGGGFDSRARYDPDTMSGQKEREIMDTVVGKCSACARMVEPDCGGLCDVCFAGLPDGEWSRPIPLPRQLVDAGENRIVESGGWGWRFRLEPDDCADINDFDCYGRVAPVVLRYGEQQERPDGFDGFARIVDGWRGERFWWQPPAVLMGNDDAVRSLARLVSDILAYGFTMVRVERLRLDDSDGYGNPIVDDYDVLCGVEPFVDDGYAADILSDLIAGLGV